MVILLKNSFMKYFTLIICLFTLSACENGEVNTDKVPSQHQIENSLTPTMDSSVVSVPLSGSSSQLTKLPIVGTGSNP